MFVKRVGVSQHTSFTTDLTRAKLMLYVYKDVESFLHLHEISCKAYNTSTKSSNMGLPILDSNLHLSVLYNTLPTELPGLSSVQTPVNYFILIVVIQ